MITHISIALTDKLIANNIVSSDERELFIYGFFVLISHFMYLLINVILGLVFSVLIESLIFCFFFQLIRRFAGGYHASTETKCEVLSLLSILVSSILMMMSKIYDLKNILMIVSFVSAAIIFYCCPIDTQEKPLSDEECNSFRMISWTILLIMLLIIIVSYFWKLNFLYVPCCVSLILENILIISGRKKRKRENERAKR